jgi:hypothetical protein
VNAVDALSSIVDLADESFNKPVLMSDLIKFAAWNAFFEMLFHVFSIPF